MINGHIIVIETPNGNTEYTVVGDHDEASRFSIKQRLNSES
jgi:hypothetical protein